VESLNDVTRVTGSCVSPLDALGHLSRIEVTEEEARRLSMGQALSAAGYPGLDASHPADSRAGREPIAVACGEALVAVATREGDGIRPKKVFTN
jgi:hypothetical protein